MDTVAQVLQETIEKVSAPGLGSRDYKGAIRQAGIRIKQATGIAMQAQKKLGRHTTYTKALGKTICERVSNGETLKSVCKDLNIPFHLVFRWTERDKIFGDAYRVSRQDMAVSLVEDMIDGLKGLENDKALAARVQADVIKWVASKFNPQEFSDIKRIELKGEINHHHTHDLAIEQKRRIAESWLISQEQDVSLPAITAETSGPDLPALEGAAVREICETEQGERPKRKRSAQSASADKSSKASKQRGRPRKMKGCVDDKMD